MLALGLTGARQGERAGPVGSAPYGRHAFVGGNVLVLSMLRDHADELGVTAPREAFDATIRETRVQLQERTARAAIEDVQRRGERLGLSLRVENRTGHKLPTGYPSRRVWVRATVRDANGRLVDQEGSVLPTELAGGPVRSHRDTVRDSNEVATFEAIMADVDGLPTHTLLRAAT
ncbi:MAG: hypothetical protein GY711_02905 [bacterium]|nr:hypothetical protein [bacterium]